MFLMPQQDENDLGLNLSQDDPDNMKSNESVVTDKGEDGNQPLADKPVDMDLDDPIRPQISSQEKKQLKFLMDG